MTRHSILKTFKHADTSSPSVPKTTSQLALTGSKYKVLPKKSVSKLEISSMKQMQIYRKKGLLRKDSALLSSVCLQKTGFFDGFCHMLDFLAMHNEPEQMSHHSSIFKKLARKIKSKGVSSSLQLKLVRCDDYAKQFLSSIKNSLKTCKVLKSVSLTCRLLESTNNFCLPLITKTLSFVHITSFSIDFRFSELTHSNIKGFAKGLSKLRKLKSLSLNLSAALPGFGFFANEEFLASPLLTVLQGLTNLEELEIDLSRNSLLPTDSLKQISSSLSKLTNLKKLSINLSNTPFVSATNFLYIITPLQNLSSLEYLSLDLNNCLKEPQNIVNFADAFGSLKSLKSLHLFCDNWPEVSLQGTKALARSIGKLKGLNELVLTLNGWTQAGFKAIEALADVVYSLKGLRILALDLSHWGKDLMLNYEGNFAECDNPVTDQILSYLGERLSLLPFLRELALYVSGIRGISAKGITNMMTFISTKKSLRTLLFTADGYDEFSGQEILETTKLLDKFKKLKGALSFKGLRFDKHIKKELYMLVKHLQTKIQLEFHPDVNSFKRRNRTEKARGQILCF